MKKILIIQTAFPGDAILTLPFIQKIKTRFQNSLISVIAIPATQEIFASSPAVDKVLILDKKGKHKSFSNLISFIKSLRRQKFNFVFSPHRSFRSTLIANFCKAGKTHGFDRAAFSWLYDNVIKYENTFHEVRRNLSLLGEKTDEENWKIKPVLKADSNKERKINDFLKTLPEKTLFAIAPSTVWETKRYPEKYFIELAKYLEKHNGTILLLGGKSDSPICESIEKSVGSNCISVAGMFSIVESIELIKHCKFLISNDSAPTHMALCAGIPVLTLYCSTIPGFGFWPYSSNSGYVSFEDLSCKPCGIHGHKECPKKHFDCGWKLKPEIIIEKLEKEFLFS